MTTSSIRAKIDCPIERVWAVVTAVDDYSWRSDLSGTEILDERRFVEYAKGGFATTFTVTAMETCRRWEFDMENANMTGHWSGVFTAGDGATEIEFTECVEAKRLLKFLDYFLGVSSENLPKNSIVREFVGGSCFRV